MTTGGPLRRLAHRSRPGALGVRRRILLTFTLGSIALSLFLAVTTYGLTKSNVKGAKLQATERVWKPESVV